MKNFKLLWALAFVAIAAFPGCDDDDDDDNPLTTENYVEFNGDMRELWSDHMQWTYSTVDAFFHDPDGVNGHLTRLLQNQQDIGDAIRPYYGDEVADSLTALLTTHINQAVPVLTAAQNDDQEALGIALANWYSNAHDIGHYLASANPDHWDENDLEHHMEEHIDQTVAYAVDLLNNDHTNAVIHYDIAFDHMMDLADILAEGIAKQFPGEF